MWCACTGEIRWLTTAESRFLLPASIISARESLRDSKVEEAVVTSEACASRVLGPIPPSRVPHDLCIRPTPCPIPRPQAVGYAFSFSFPSMVSPNSFRKTQPEFSTTYADSYISSSPLPHIISLELRLKSDAILHFICSLLFCPHFLFSNLFLYTFSCVQSPILGERQWFLRPSKTAIAQTIFVILHL